MKREMLKKLFWGVCLTSVLTISATEINAQGGPQTSSTTKPAEAKKLSLQDELMEKLRASMKNPADYVANLSEYLNKYPYSDSGTCYLYSLSRTFKDTKDANETRDLILQFIKNTENVPNPLKVEIYRRSADTLFAKDLFEDSAKLAQDTINLFNDKDFLEFKKKQHSISMTEYAAKYPNFKPREFDAPRTMAFYVASKTDVYNLLGRSFEQQNNFDEAEKAYRNSVAIKTSKNSALGLARAAEKNGKDADALKYATIAVLTGKLTPAEMDYFYAVYAKSHQGKTDNSEAYLDAEFKKTYQNPVKSKKYQRTSKRSDRTVLVEFFTGAGCVPCMPFDYAFENALNDYSRKEIAILSYHWHAPTMDPLGNNSSDSRVNYYGIKGAPTVFIDGKRFEKDGDYNGGDEEKNEIQPIAENVYETLNTDLETPAAAEIKLKAKRNGEKIAVQVDAGKFKNVAEDVTLQVALVENETSYSGENGLRFHFMVVRALAGDNEKREFGFKIDSAKSNKFDYVFDVDKIVAQNLTYYDTQKAERTKEFLERVKATSLDGFGIDFKFNYQKNQVNPKNLSVIAYLQDNKTKKILQSSVIDLSSK